MKKKTRLFVAFVLFGMILMTFPVVANASNDNYPYSFTLLPQQGNSYSSPKFRTTSNYDNAWKVNMTYNSEGVGTKATYWTVVKLTFQYSEWHIAVSTKHTIAQGSGAHYYTMNSDDKDESVDNYVYLAGENNNDNWDFEEVSGYWDEETGIIL